MKMDRRKLKTRRLLQKALLEVIEEKGAGRVTVSDITKKADVNRGTFYLHYTDSMDMLQKVKEEVWEGLRERIDKLDPFDYLHFANNKAPYPSLVDVVEYCGENADFFRVILGPQGDPSYRIRIKDYLIKQHLSNILNSEHPKVSNSLLPFDFLIASIASANLSILQHWIDTDRRQSPGEIALMITQLIGNGAFQLLDTNHLPRR
ncbi:TetR/AcrR family transcriptional regulator C-terminal domain-containing protein [Paenibacillus lautus]|uniref:TetR/AcrR family transcriptional regulator n=1 Tax=Bacillales TaxID=1385 RepID=UPI00203EA02B|nr:TetR/AcrR family transcriptional regulator C-terminal domain-containing protein [Paenibacillus lautus]MCM3257848.1 TetR/AcrR family transcriptional regulator C-terminal domain-containing protein [Paenibacillus lautus]